MTCPWCDGEKPTVEIQGCTCTGPCGKVWCPHRPEFVRDFTEGLRV